MRTKRIPSVMMLRPSSQQRRRCACPERLANCSCSSSAAVLTNDDDTAQQCRCRRDIGKPLVTTMSTPKSAWVLADRVAKVLGLQTTNALRLCPRAATCAKSVMLKEDWRVSQSKPKVSMRSERFDRGEVAEVSEVGCNTRARLPTHLFLRTVGSRAARDHLLVGA